MFTSKRKLKKSLASAEDQIQSLKDQVRALEDTTKLLSTELAESKEKVDAAAETDHVDDEQILSQQLAVEVEDGDVEEKTPPQEKEQAPSCNVADVGELQKTIIDELPAAQNRELDANVATTAEEEALLEENSAIEKDNATIEMAKAPSNNGGSDEGGQLHKASDCLTASNAELELNVASALEDKAYLESRLTEKINNISIPPEQAHAPNTGDECEEPHKTKSELTEQERRLSVSFCSAIEGWDEFEACENKSPPQRPACNVDDDNREPQQIIKDLTKHNQELEANMALLSNENSKLVTRLAKEKNKSIQRKTEAKERRKKFESKLANMSEQLKEDFSDEQLLDGGVDNSFASLETHDDSSNV
mmetsp:Transcript_28776/g.61370  ORF Transcript_28776/g.61370 Transcript_28776/m.61370 type:complete len:363 (+) Transcript_28776:121-1209(+)|eukprot:CAMPEP_0172306408 /NCGR_PEP_ID=MMETSP1058-20130122/7485_1 /TAXON_ID=83371 /ORGANISM="Detonula confervacea, Strain CCMP 353" /LENGTH=362 /DNA_ID=CAMNT_0013018283 /DNA_START=48 /DNA_END=1136 /DNA_ORIENTATION=-